MVMKVSTSMFFDKASKQLGSIQGSLAKTQEQLSTGKQITKPSDEPDKASLITPWTLNWLVKKATKAI